MSALLAAGWSRSSCHGVSVVPMIQCSPHGMTNSTLVGVRRIRPGRVRRRPRRRVDRRARHHQVHALGGAHPQARAPTSPSIAPMSSLHTPVAATTLRARTSNDGPVGQVGDPDADDRAPSGRRRRRGAARRPGRWRAPGRRSRRRCGRRRGCAGRRRPGRPSTGWRRGRRRRAGRGTPRASPSGTGAGGAGSPRPWCSAAPSTS